MNSEKILVLKGLTKTFGSIVANFDVNLDLHRGEILALLGENGAGKTTLMNMLFGHYIPDAGQIEVADANHRFLPLTLGHPQSAIAAGIGMVHQHFTLAENLDAVDNIMLGSETFTLFPRKRPAAKVKIHNIMAQSGLLAPLDIPVGKLTVGERQRIEILKALYRNVKILVLDEPTAVLTPQQADALFENIRSMANDGLSVIFISHKLQEVLAFSHRIMVLRSGRNAGEIQTDKADEQKIARMMVGAETPSHVRHAQVNGPAILQFKDVSVQGRSRRESLKNVDLKVLSGEILGIAGVSGNGQTALAGAISGMLNVDNGEILIENQLLSNATPAAMIAHSIGRIPEDRHRDGIVGSMSVAENMIIEQLGDPKIQQNGFLRPDAIREYAEMLSSEYDVRGPGEQAAAQLLSGGNIQKLILARIFDRRPKVILANQPTRGLDMVAAAEVARRLLDARGRGAGIVLISEDLDEILKLSDRIFVIHDGVFSEAETRDRAKLGLMMAGQPA